jgi:hypothetical protein
MKQFNKIYFNGSSFTAGGGLEVPSEKDIHAVWPINGYKQKGLDIDWKHNKEVAYPQRVSDELNIKVINDSIQGGSWNRVVRSFWEYISNNDESNTLFVLEYPGGLRDEFFSTKLNDYILVNTDSTIDWIMESYKKTAGQRSYENLDFNKDRNIVYEPLKSYYQYLFNPDCILHFKKEIISMYGILLHCENNKIPLIISNPNRLLNQCTDKNFAKQFKKLFNQEFKYSKFTEHILDFCTERKLKICDDLVGLVAGYKSTEIKDGQNVKTEPYEYNDAHPGYYGHIEYGKYLTEKIQEWYK